MEELKRARGGINVMLVLGERKYTGKEENDVGRLTCGVHCRLVVECLLCSEVK